MIPISAVVALIVKCGVPPLSDVDDVICLRRMQRTDCTKLPGAGW